MDIPKGFKPDDKDLEEKLDALLHLRRKKKFKYAPQFNDLGKRVDDENVQYFYDLWCEEVFTSNKTQKEEVAEAYCIHFLGVSQEIFEAFKQEAYQRKHWKYYSSEAEKEIGLRQGGAIKRKEDVKSFWGTIKKIFPLDYPEDDLAYLIGNGALPVMHMMFQFEFFCKTNPLLDALRVNAHVYK